MCDLTHSYEWYDSCKCVTRLIHTCDMTHSYIRLDSFLCATWPLDLGGILIETLVFNVTWLLHVCDITHSYVWHDSSTLVTCLIHDLCMSVTWRLIHMSHVWIYKWGTTQVHETCDSVWMSHVTERHNTRKWVMWQFDMLHPHVCHDSCTHASTRAPILRRTTPILPVPHPYHIYRPILLIHACHMTQS